MDLAKYFSPINENTVDEQWKDVAISECHEELVLIDGLNPHLISGSQYYKQGIPGAVKACYVRKTVADMLLQAIELLPVGCSLFVFDSWRPQIVQKYLFDCHVQELKKEHAGLREDDLIRLAQDFVSIPSTDPHKPSPHFTGGAVDLTIMDEKGILIPMGTDFDSFSAKAYTAYYEKKINERAHLTYEEINCCLNRRLLYNIMITAGFSNYANEWWHYDYGNQMWGFYTKHDAVYGLCTV